MIDRERDRAPTLVAGRLRRAASSLKRLSRRFTEDESGSYLIITAVAMPLLVGMAAFGSEEGLLLHNQKTMQHAADSAAATAAVAISAGANDKGTLQARSVAATYGFVDGASDHTTVNVNSPPLTGPYANNSSAVEVIILQPEERLFSRIWGSAPIIVKARAVSTPQAQPCILALNKVVSGAYSEQGSVSVNLVKCAVIDDSSNASSALNVGGAATLSASFVGVVGGISSNNKITATNGIVTGYHYVADPYAGVSYPAYSGCDKNNYSANSDATVSPGVYCGGIDLKSHAHLTLNSGVYYLDRGSLSMTGQTQLTGTGVTLVFTSSTGSNYATASVAGGATINLTAPTSGPTAGIVLFGDRSMPVGTSFKLTGGDTETFGGAVYLSKASVQWAGNATLTQPCTQLIADTISLVGNTGLKIDCAGYGTKSISTLAALVE